jgi:hypothetical protein
LVSVAWRSRYDSSPATAGYTSSPAVPVAFCSVRLLELAVTKDGGFTVETFLDALRAIARLTPADWAEDGISQQDAQRLRTVFDGWHAELASG